uniref:FBD domain-containing protein n=1 Tax=Setaria digitata TaxID=48799 RepID=A0A915PR64_9BILA
MKLGKKKHKEMEILFATQNYCGKRTEERLTVLSFSRTSEHTRAKYFKILKVYIVTAAVKKLVVGFASQDLVHPLDENWASRPILPVFPTLP